MNCIKCSKDGVDAHGKLPTLIKQENALCTLIEYIDGIGPGIDIRVPVTDLRDLFNNDALYIHHSCRVNLYCQMRSRKRSRQETDESGSSNTQARSTRSRQSTDSSSSSQVHIISGICFYCGKRIDRSRRHPDRNITLCDVQTYSFHESLKSAIESRGSDSWGEEVRLRLSTVYDMIACEAVYHAQCDTNFRTGKRKPLKFDDDTDSYSTSTKPGGAGGRPKDITNSVVFLKVIERFETEHEGSAKRTVLEEEFTTLHPDNEVISRRDMDRRLDEHYGDLLARDSALRGRVVLKSRSSDIMKSFLQKTDDTRNEEQLVITAANLVKEEIRCTPLYSSSCENFPDVINLSEESLMTDVPSLLKIFLGRVRNRRGQHTSMHVISLAHCIMQDARPRTLLMPIPLAVGLVLYFHTGSRFLIDLLFSLGLCASYPKVTTYIKSAAVEQDVLKLSLENHFLQFIADNVDHQTDTIDGKNTIHVMGTIAAINPRLPAQSAIKNRSVSTTELISMSQHLLRKCDVRKKDYFGEVKCEVSVIVKLAACPRIDLLHSTMKLIRRDMTRSIWSGDLMFFSNPAPDGSDGKGASTLLNLALINLPPSDIDCIYSTLKYVQGIAHKHHKVAVVTFDQPLYWKSKSLVTAAPQDLEGVFVRLGTFHLILSMFAGIGKLMKNTGLQEIMSTIYAENTAVKILNGKAYKRAVRAYSLIYIALTKNLLEALGLSADDTSPETLQEATSNITAHSKTAKLWLQLMTIIELVIALIKSERTGDYRQMVDSITSLLPYLAASGRNLYTKSLWVFIQDLLNLPVTYPDLHAAFTDGHDVIRRTSGVNKGVCRRWLEPVTLPLTSMAETKQLSTCLGTGRIGILMTSTLCTSTSARENHS